MLSAMEEGTKRRTTTTTRTENPKRQVDTASEKRLSENGVSSRILDQRGVGLRWSASRRMMIAILSLLVAGLMVILSIRIQLLSRIAVLRGVTLLPVACCTFSAFQQWRRRQYYCAIIPAAAVLTVVAAQLPSFLAVGIAAGSIVAFGLATRPVEDNAPRHVATSKATTRSQSMADSTVSSMAVIQGVLVVIAVLLSENFLIWVVSATFEAGQHITTEPPPLQDNGQRVLKYILSTLTKPQVIGLRRLLNTQWSLVSCLGASFAYVELHRYGRTGPFTTAAAIAHRTLFGVATRMAYTVAIARFVRTASFLLTVLPSQVRNCYAQRFPVPPPTYWVDWIWVGLIPRSHGGCNDLIISGHAVITSSMACVATSVADDAIFSMALWSMVVLDYAVEIYEGYHYSVDMWLGIVLVSLLWRVLQPLEGIAAPSPSVSNGNTVVASAEQPHCPATSTATDLPHSPRDPPLTSITLVTYVFPAVVAYLQLILLPQWTANFLIVLYVLTAVIIYVSRVWKEQQETRKQVYMHVTQHVLLCLLFMALGIYL